jgi:hypothetical protein
LLCTQDPGKNGGDAIGSSGAAGGGPASNPARAHRSPAGEEQREGLGATTVRFVCLVGGEGPPAGVDSGTRRRTPLELLLRRARGRGKQMGGAASS